MNTSKSFAKIIADAQGYVDTFRKPKIVLWGYLLDTLQQDFLQLCWKLFRGVVAVKKTNKTQYQIYFGRKQLQLRSATAIFFICRLIERNG